MSLVNIDAFEWTLLAIQAVCVVGAFIAACKATAHARRATWHAKQAREIADRMAR